VSNLFHPDNRHSRFIRIAFLLTFSSLLGNYRKHYYENEFDRQEYLECQPESTRVNSMVFTTKFSQEFLEQFLQTQAFLQFENVHNALFDELLQMKLHGKDLDAKCHFLLTKFNHPSATYEFPKVSSGTSEQN
jgi:hypothetical protein